MPAWRPPQALDLRPRHPPAVPLVARGPDPAGAIPPADRVRAHAELGGGLSHRHAGLPRHCLCSYPARDSANRNTEWTGLPALFSSGMLWGMPLMPMGGGKPLHDGHGRRITDLRVSV